MFNPTTKGLWWWCWMQRTMQWSFVAIRQEKPEKQSPTKRSSVIDTRKKLLHSFAWVQWSWPLATSTIPRTTPLHLHLLSSSTEKENYFFPVSEWIVAHLDLHNFKYIIAKHSTSPLNNYCSIGDCTANSLSWTRTLEPQQGDWNTTFSTDKLVLSSWMAYLSTNST